MGVSSVLHFSGMTASEAFYLKRSSFLERWIFSKTSNGSRKLLIQDLNADTLPTGRSFPELTPLAQTWTERMTKAIDLLKSVRRGFVPAVLAPPIKSSSVPPDPTWMKSVLFGVGHAVNADTWSVSKYNNLKELSLFWPFYHCYGSAPQSQMYALAKSLIDSGKMLKLDELLRTLKAGGHRILLFSQMTMMMNILEDYLSFRRYRSPISSLNSKNRVFLGIFDWMASQ